MPRTQRNDNFVDKTFTVIADIILKALPTNRKSKEAFAYYRDGMSAQADGEYAEALENYHEALKLEEDPYDRSFILYNVALVHTSNGDHDKAIDYYNQAIDLNPRMPQAFNNIAVIYHFQGERLQENGQELQLKMEQAQSQDDPEKVESLQSEIEALLTEANELFDKAAEYWTRAIRLAPNNYIEAQNWLKTTGRAKIDAYF
jgi:tetratricopeptide (TPR) repeat protein